mmetsp:Transcript_21296/g.55374  ORF Transcript_21296/g.55374 Transcript_21296/m.55374 type:complete len:350 (+) Transcript_21296:1673-2722(+)
MRVDDGDHLPSLFTKLVLEPLGVGEESLVPREVALAISMLDIQPDDVSRNIMNVKVIIHIQYICFILVVPPALVIGSGEPWRHEGSSSHEGILVKHMLVRRSDKEQDIHLATLTYPVCISAILPLSFYYIDVCFGRIQPQHSRRPRPLSIMPEPDHEGDRTVQRLCLSSNYVILEHIQVVQAVWLHFGRAISSARGRKAEGGCPLGDTENVRGANEGDISTKRGRTARLAVIMRLPSLIPKAIPISDNAIFRRSNGGWGCIGLLLFLLSFLLGFFFFLLTPIFIQSHPRLFLEAFFLGRSLGLSLEVFIGRGLPLSLMLKVEETSGIHVEYRCSPIFNHYAKRGLLNSD